MVVTEATPLSIVGYTNVEGFFYVCPPLFANDIISIDPRGKMPS